MGKDTGRYCEYRVDAGCYQRMHFPLRLRVSGFDSAWSSGWMTKTDCITKL